MKREEKVCCEQKEGSTWVGKIARHRHAIHTFRLGSLRADIVYSVFRAERSDTCSHDHPCMGSMNPVLPGITREIVSDACVNASICIRRILDGDFVTSRDYPGRVRSLHNVAIPVVDTSEMKHTAEYPH